MSWIGLLLLGCATGDWFRARLRSSKRIAAVQAATVVVVGVSMGLISGRDLTAILLLAAAAAGWGVAVGGAAGSRRTAPWIPLTYGASVLGVLALFMAPFAGHVSGPFAKWAAWQEVISWPGGMQPGDALLLLLGAFAVQFSTGNVIVMLLLDLAGVGADDAIKGGPLIGTLERLLIVGLGLAGEYTAAGIVMAAKAVRAQDLQRIAVKDPDKLANASHYVLAGSLLSWGVALGTLALIGK